MSAFASDSFDGECQLSRHVVLGLGDHLGGDGVLEAQRDGSAQHEQHRPVVGSFGEPFADAVELRILLTQWAYAALAGLRIVPSLGSSIQDEEGRVLAPIELEVHQSSVVGLETGVPAVLPRPKGFACHLEILLPGRLALISVRAPTVADLVVVPGHRHRQVPVREVERRGRERVAVQDFEKLRRVLELEPRLVRFDALEQPVGAFVDIDLIPEPEAERRPRRQRLVAAHLAGGEARKQRELVDTARVEGPHVAEQEVAAGSKKAEGLDALVAGRRRSGAECQVPHRDLVVRVRLQPANLYSVRRPFADLHDVAVALRAYLRQRFVWRRGNPQYHLVRGR